jgi:hypothetical protein
METRFRAPKEEIPLINTPFWTISNKFTGTSTSSFYYGEGVHETKPKTKGF